MAATALAYTSSIALPLGVEASRRIRSVSSPRSLGILSKSDPAQARPLSMTLRRLRVGIVRAPCPSPRKLEICHPIAFASKAQRCQLWREKGAVKMHVRHRTRITSRLPRSREKFLKVQPLCHGRCVPQQSKACPDGARTNSKKSCAALRNFSAWRRFVRPRSVPLLLATVRNQRMPMTEAICRCIWLSGAL
jgi:hypothetical protein